MSIKLVCPECSRSLFAPDDVLGETVKCEHCSATFTARAGFSTKAAELPPRREPESEPPRPSAKRKSRDVDGEDEKPRRKPPRAKKGTNPLPFLIAGGGLALFALTVCGGVFAVLWSQSRATRPQVATGPNVAPLQAPVPNVQPIAPQPAAAAPAPVLPPARAAAAGLERVALSNARWTGFGGRDFSVDYAFGDGQRPFGGMFVLKWKDVNGQTGSADLNFLQASGTLNIKAIGGLGRRSTAMDIWMEQGAFGGPFAGNGQKISNVVQLN